MIQKLRNSLSVGNRSSGTIKVPNFQELKDAKHAIILISNQMEFYQKKTIKYALLAGQSLEKIQQLCKIKRKKFHVFLRECGVKWNKSYTHFLISFYKISLEYPKLSNISLSIHFVKNNFKRIKSAISSTNEETEYWKKV